MEEDTHSVQSPENMEELMDLGADGEEDVELHVTPAMKKSVESSGENTKKRKKPESKEAVSPLFERPSRERKSVERFIDSIEKEKEKPKDLKIEQGSGTCLRDIPNVVFKFSKRKWNDETVQFLHKLLYNRRAKPLQVKANILQYSGWVWGPNEEREKAKLKEKLEKCFKDSLWQVSDVFDLNLPKITKKEDMVLKVFEFLDCPYKASEKLLEEKNQKAKKKKRQKTAGTGKKSNSGQTRSKKQKREGKSSKGGLEEEEEEEEEYDDDEQDPQVDPEEEPEEVEEEPEEVQPKKRSSAKPKKPSSARKGLRSVVKHSSNSEDAEAAVEEEEEAVEKPEEVDNDPEKEEELEQKQDEKKKTDNVGSSESPKRSGRKHSKTKSVNEAAVAAAQEEDGNDDNKSKPPSQKTWKTKPSKEARAPQGKKKSDTGPSKAGSRQRKNEEKGIDSPLEEQKKIKGKTSQPESKEERKGIPSDDNLRAAICDVLNEADFSTVTFMDVIKRLEAKFNVDLSERKAPVRIMIQEEISKLVDEDDGEAEGEAEDVEK